MQVVDKNVAQDVLLAETQTKLDGGYRVSFAASAVKGKARPDLQARVYSGPDFLAASETRYDASHLETLNVSLPAETGSLASEYEALLAAIAPYYKGVLGDLKETNDQQDITYLANKTGWDARAIALAALADQFSRNQTEASGAPLIKPAFYYALFRAGLPANPDTLYQTDSQTVEGIWNQSITQAVIANSLFGEINPSLKAFQSLAAQVLLTGSPVRGVSSLSEMLAALQLNDTQQKQFAQLYAEHRNDLPKFWQEIDRTLGSPITAKLQLNGKLGFLTLNNVPLMAEVHGAAGSNGLNDPLELAQQGYHRADRWRALLNDNIPVPREIPGGDIEEIRTNYAEYLAAQIRLSYPTAAVAEIVKTDLATHLPTDVHTFLTAHQGRFEIGAVPVDQYVARNNVQINDDTLEHLKRLQRVYQITPSDHAMTALIKRGVDSAYQVAHYHRDDFVQTFAQDLGGAEAAAQTYDKSVQVHNAVINLAISYLSARNAVGLGALPLAGAGDNSTNLQILEPMPNGGAERQESNARAERTTTSMADSAAPNADDLLAYDTLENLFGSMDFCACDHCRSILSPAAYLVDLLHFIDREPVQADTQAGMVNPQKVLFDRRPDIQHLPLTCENTNTALPYIDVVNETLEYFIANQTQPMSLNGYLGHDTGAVASEDLLATPQILDAKVRDAAYDRLRAEIFPTTLPFHQPLENLRRYFGKFEIPLPLAMERLCPSDDLSRGSNPYGWEDILMETLQLSRKEYDLLTKSGATPKVLGDIYGFPANTQDTEAIKRLSNAKAFARRLEITYDDLVAILKTRFVNPNSDLIPKLERLGVPFAALKTLKDGLAETEFVKLLPKGTLAPDEAEYDGSISQWVKQQDNYDRIMGILTLAIPLKTWTAGEKHLIGDCVRPTSPPSGSTLYYECTKPGTSGNSEPTSWPDIPGKTFADNNVEWICRDLSDSGNFGAFAFQYADPAKAVGVPEYVRLLRFIRLWKKLGWTIEETDAAICALFPVPPFPQAAAAVDDPGKLNTGFLNLLRRLAVIVRVMELLNLTTEADLLPLLACWSPLGTHGVVALYRQMFLNPTLLKQDPIFADNAYGEFLQRVETSYSQTQATLDQSIVNVASGKLGYSHARKRLSYVGVLTAATRDALVNHTGVSNDFRQAVKTLYRSQRLFSHAEAVRAALNLTGSEFTLIFNSLKFTPDAAATGQAPAELPSGVELTPLTIENIGAIYRRGWLARKLNLSIAELLKLIRVTNLDPFAAIDPAKPDIIRFIRLVQAIRERSLSPAAVLYLIWNQDLSGSFTPDPAQVADCARTLRLAFTDIESEFVIKDDPNGAIAQNRLALVYGPEAAAFFLGLLNDSISVVVDFSDPHSTMGNTTTRQAIEHAAGQTAAGKPKIHYDDFSHRLSYVGVMREPIPTNIKTAASGDAEFALAIDGLFAKNQKTVNPFFGRYSELESFYASHSNEPLDAKLGKVMTVLLPDLIKRQKTRRAFEVISVAAQTDLDFARVLLGNSSGVKPFHASGDRTQPALNDILALERRGLLAKFFVKSDIAAPRLFHTEIAANLDYEPNGDNPFPEPNGAVTEASDHAGTDGSLSQPGQVPTISGIWTGYIEAPDDGFFNLLIETDRGATVTLKLDGKPVSLKSRTTLFSNSAPIEWRAGTLHAIELEINNVSKIVRVSWETAGRGLTNISPRYLYPADLFDAFRQVYLRFLKACLLANSLKLRADEIGHFAASADYRIKDGVLDASGESWLNFLPNADNLNLTDSRDIKKAQALNTALLTPLRALLDYARIKEALAPNDDSLLTVLNDPKTVKANGDGLLLTLTRWDDNSLNDLLFHLFGIMDSAGVRHFDLAELEHFDKFRRVFDAFELLKLMGVSAQALIQATTNEPTADTVRDLQAALRARYGAVDWRTLVRPINDEMRGLQRDALVAFILHQMRSDEHTQHIDTADKLFEYFLMDVKMEPCMQTSRIRHALSSVQLFIERCLMNLEAHVAPAAIDTSQWEWMKRYRVWEANRKLSLVSPENWLEPELRDNKSVFFKEFESELLQSDITEESATTALLNYLSKLDEVAKLEPCGLYCVEGDPNKQTDDIYHVVARTSGAHRKYFYRRREHGYWTSWEQIKLDIEDNPVIPVVWKDRLLLFWLRILKQAAIDPNVLPTSSGETGTLATLTPESLKREVKTSAQDTTKVRVQAVLCWSEFYNGAWRPTKTSNVDKPITIDVFPAQGSTAFDRAQVSLIVRDRNEGLWINIGYQDRVKSAFLLHNTHSLPVSFDPSDYSFHGLAISIELGYDRQDVRFLDVNQVAQNGGPLVNTYYRGYRWEIGGWRWDRSLPRTLLGSTSGFKLVEPRYLTAKPFDSPFFLEDAHHAFLVKTTEREIRIPDHNDIGSSSGVGTNFTTHIPPLVLAGDSHAVLGPKIWTDGTADSGNLGVTDPGAIGRRLSEDAHIHQGIGAAGSVNYGGRLIGVSGSFADLRAGR